MNAHRGGSLGAALLAAVASTGCSGVCAPAAPGDCAAKPFGVYELQPACPAGTVTDQPLLVAFGVALDDGGTATQLDGNSRCDERWQGCRLALTCVNQGILDVSFDSANDALTGTRSECDYCYPHDGGTPTRACQYRGVHN